MCAQGKVGWLFNIERLILWNIDDLWPDGGIRGPSLCSSQDLGYIYLVSIYLKRRRAAQCYKGHVLCFSFSLLNEE